tara:strand:+ start:1229 stop:2044 length:816 start_codon:yes stop_codon:yes gene_type:complete
MKIKLLGKEFSITTQSITLTYILLICIGYLIENVYYSKFGIEIENYLNFEEYLFIFLALGSLLILITVALILYFSGLTGFLYWFQNRELFQNKEKTKNSNERKSLKIDIPERFEKIIWLIKSISIAMVILSPVIFVLLYYDHETDFFPWIFLRKFIIFWIFLMFISGVLYAITIEYDNRFILFIVTTILSSMVLYFFDVNYEKSKNILSGKPIKEIQFKLNDETIITSKTILYIGETRDYLFLRDIISNTNHIYQKKQILALKSTDVSEQK